MKAMWIVIFFALPIVGVTYVLWHIWHLLPFANSWRWVATGVGAVLFLTMFAGFSGIIEKLPLDIATATYEVGNSFIFILLYLVMIFLALDLGRVAHIVPKAWLISNGYTATAILALMLAVFGYGNIHYYHKTRQQLQLTTAKPIAFNGGEAKIVLLSDLHLGYHNRREEFKKWVDTINAERPDLILIAGDIIDISVRPLLEERVAEEFHRLKAPVYATLGNHEYYSGSEKARKFYHDAGITLLRDSVVSVGGIAIIGRDDRTNVHRKPLVKLMSGVPKGEFSILLDHQPYHLEEAEHCGVDFQFSGHTHYGQVWPASWITRAMYEKAYGYTQKGHTHYYVSSGMGIWGGKFRIGTQSEYVVLTIKR